MYPMIHLLPLLYVKCPPPLLKKLVHLGVFITYKIKLLFLCLAGVPDVILVRVKAKAPSKYHCFKSPLVYNPAAVTILPACLSKEFLCLFRIVFVLFYIGIIRPGFWHKRAGGRASEAE